MAIYAFRTQQEASVLSAIRRLVSLRKEIVQLHVLAQIGQGQWRYIGTNIPDTLDTLAATKLMEINITEHVKRGIHIEED